MQVQVVKLIFFLEFILILSQEFQEVLLNNPSKSHAIVMIVNADNGEILNAYSAAITGDVGVEELTNEFELNLYPNPASDVVNVSFTLENASEVKLTVTDAVGNEVLVSEAVLMGTGQQHLSINGAALSEGFYFDNLTVGNQIVTKRLALVH